MGEYGAKVITTRSDSVHVWNTVFLKSYFAKRLDRFPRGPLNLPSNKTIFFLFCFLVKNFTINFFRSKVTGRLFFSLLTRLEFFLPFIWPEGFVTVLFENGEEGVGSGRPKKHLLTLLLSKSITVETQVEKNRR